MHNPYQFYAKHILNLRWHPDVGDPAGAREFGTCVHDVLERCTKDGIADAAEIVRMLESDAEKYIGRGNVLFRFWQNRFREMAPVISELMKKPARAEETIQMTYGGHNFIAKADRIENGNRAIDYKTGALPSDTQLGLEKELFCAMPQLPLEAMILRETTGISDVSMAFLSLRKNHVGMVEYDVDKTSRSIDAVIKTLEIALNTTKYARPDHYLDDKYTDFDDLCRYGD
jgi:RecB family exonuclease